MIRIPPRPPRAVLPAMHALAFVLAASLACAVPAIAAGPASDVAGATSRSSATSYVAHLADLINAYRARNGVAPLALSRELDVLASEHSTRMAQTRRLSHEGFRDRFDRTDARICVENVGVNFAHPEAQLAGWQASPGHHRNLLEPKVARMGLATARSFVTFFACS